MSELIKANGHTIFLRLNRIQVERREPGRKTIDLNTDIFPQQVRLRPVNSINNEP